MKKFSNAAAASVLAGALVLAATPANAATTAPLDTPNTASTADTAATVSTAATAAPETAKTEKVEKTGKAAKEEKAKLTWEEKQKRDRAQIEITNARLDNAKKGLDVTSGIIKSAGEIKDLFTPSFLKGDGASSLIKGIAKIVGKILL